MGALLGAQRCVRMMGTSQGLGKAGPVQSRTAAAGLSQHENPGVWLSQMLGLVYKAPHIGGLCRNMLSPISGGWKSRDMVSTGLDDICGL